MYPLSTLPGSSDWNRLAKQFMTSVSSSSHRVEHREYLGAHVGRRGASLGHARRRPHDHRPQVSTVSFMSFLLSIQSKLKLFTNIYLSYIGILFIIFYHWLFNIRTWLYSILEWSCYVFYMI